MINQSGKRVFALAGLAWLVCGVSSGQQKEQSQSRQFAQSVERAVEYLRGTQSPDGSFSGDVGPGVTALVTTSLIKQGIKPDDPMVKKALTYLENFIQTDGGIYGPQSLLKNYETSLTAICLVAANQDGRYDEVLKKANTFLKGSQWGADGSVETTDHAYGGWGYGKHGRPDLSNTTFTIEALRELGTDENDAAIQRALVFLTRTQNHVSEHNSNPAAALENDGGFFYTPFGEGESKAEPSAGGGLRSYASMTYAGLRSMLYAGVDKDDTRVKAAAEWISRHYDLKSNPGMGAAGLYYYYHIFGKALDAIGEDVFVDDNGVAHNWRDDLRYELLSRQAPDGSWSNEENDRWMESDRNLVTGYVLLALQYCRPQ